MFSPAVQRLGVGASGGGSGDHHRPGPRSRRDKGPHARGRTLLLWVGFRAAMPGPDAVTEAPGVGVSGAWRSTDPTQRIPPPGIFGPVAEAVCLCQSHKLWFGSPCGSRGCEPQTLSLESSELGPGPGHQEPQFVSDFRAPAPPGCLQVPVWSASLGGRDTHTRLPWLVATSSVWRDWGQGRAGWA